MFSSRKNVNRAPVRSMVRHIGGVYIGISKINMENYIFIYEWFKKNLLETYFTKLCYDFYHRQMRNVLSVLYREDNIVWNKRGITVGTPHKFIILIIVISDHYQTRSRIYEHYYETRRYEHTHIVLLGRLYIKFSSRR